MGELNFDIDCWYAQGCAGMPGFPPYPRCKNICTLYKEMNCMINNCGMPCADRFLKPLAHSKKNEKPFNQLADIMKNMKQLVEEGLNLYIFSKDMESGKTTWSLKLMYKYFSDVWCGNGFRVRGYFIHVPEFLQSIKNQNYKNTDEYKLLDRYLKTVDLVVWDDITSHKLSEYDQNVLNTYISRRLQYGKSNIYNGMAQENYSESIGSLLTGRLTKCKVVELFENTNGGGKGRPIC